MKGGKEERKEVWREGGWRVGGLAESAKMEGPT